MNLQEIESLDSYAASLSEMGSSLDTEYLAGAIHEACSLAILGLQRSHLASERDALAASLKSSESELAALSQRFSELSADHASLQISQRSLSWLLSSLCDRLLGKISMLYDGAALADMRARLDRARSNPGEYLALHAAVSEVFASRFAPANLVVDRSNPQARVVSAPHLFKIGG